MRVRGAKVACVTVALLLLFQMERTLIVALLCLVSFLPPGLVALDQETKFDIDVKNVKLVELLMNPYGNGKFIDGIDPLSLEIYDERLLTITVSVTAESITLTDMLNTLGKTYNFTWKVERETIFLYRVK